MIFLSIPPHEPGCPVNPRTPYGHNEGRIAGQPASVFNLLLDVKVKDDMVGLQAT